MILTGAKKAQDQDTVGFWPVEDAIAAIGTATDTVALIEGVAWKVRQTTLRTNSQGTLRRRGYPAAD